MSDSDRNIDENRRKVIDVILNHYRDQIRISIEQKLKIPIPTIDRQEIVGFLKHQGAGGTTYILTADFHSGMRRISGGIVVKFANDLEQEVTNANELSKLLSRRMEEWSQHPAEKKLPADLPNIVFSPAVLGTHPNQHVIILEFISGGIPLLKTDFSETKKYQMLGYALGRLHGSQAFSVAMQLYEPVFRVLETVLPGDDGKRALNNWKEWLSTSRGGAEFIHGDSHLENLLYSTTAGTLAWIDAVLIPRGDRMDDLAYAISHIIQEKLISSLQQDPTQTGVSLLPGLIKDSAQHIIPHMLTTYMRTASIQGLYSKIIPIDFFLGTHLIIRSQMFLQNSKIADFLVTLGQELIVNHPLVKILGLER
ncbi:MAG TPA: hypothetical protein VJ044_09485 [Candidatus Hodarchaeales archaeon]|nr:hypothetical protein [Candidatus Hodarchaeales archaeon]